MGLDMYLKGRMWHWSCWNNPALERVEEDKKVDEIIVKLGYWRKHPDLHGFIVKTFANGKDDCKPVELSIDDLNKIIAAVQREELPHTEGFFFGDSQNDAEQIAEDVKIFEEAIAWLKRGDESPFETERMDGAGFTAVMVKPEAEARRETKQRVSRTVVYEASW
jgi:hypothetical protein